MQLAPMQLRRERAEEKYVGGTATGHAHESGERNKWAQHAPTNTIRASILNMRPCGCAPALSTLRGPHTRHTAQAASTSRAIKHQDNDRAAPAVCHTASRLEWRRALRGVSASGLRGARALGRRVLLHGGADLEGRLDGLVRGRGRGRVRVRAVLILKAASMAWIGLGVGVGLGLGRC